MRSSLLLSAALSAAVLASPVALDKRADAVVYEDDIVYLTETVTVVAGSPPAPPTPEAVAPAPAGPDVKTGAYGDGGFGDGNYGGWPWGGKHHPQPPPSAAPAPAPAPVQAPPAPAPPAQAPAPAPAPVSSPPAQSPSPPPAPAPSSPAPSGSPSPSSGSSGVAKTYKDAVVQHHNYHRANHSSPDIQWSDSLAATALKIASTCVWGHSMNVDGGGYGQNIGAGIARENIANTISDSFYNGEINKYPAGGLGDQTPTMDQLGPWGHMSAMVWASTKYVGCATVDCSNVEGQLQGISAGSNIPPVFTVCNYQQPGNVGGLYGENVKPSLGKPTITGAYNVDCNAIAASSI